VTPRQVNLLAVVSLAACWGAVLVAWVASAVYYQPQGKT
jgi:hypothetical protein